jgi:hypothetical protein
MIKKELRKASVLEQIETGQCIQKHGAQELGLRVNKIESPPSSKTLDIELINALTPQAKGRVERANKTLQDCLVKELRLQGISDITTANVYLPEFMKIYNAKFSKPVKDDHDTHRPVLHTEQELELIFSRHTQRTVSKSLEIRYHNKVLQIDQHKHRIKGAQVTHAITLLHQGQEVPFKLFDAGDVP